MQFRIFLRYVLLIGIACVVTLYLLSLVIAPIIRDNTIYMAASLDKERRLATLPSPRLVLVGGSNLALGINSPKLEAASGYSVVNMGLHAGVGLSYPLNEAKAGIRRGDIVILFIEHFLDRHTDNKKLAAQLVDVNPTAREFLYLTLFDNIRLYNQSVQRCLSGLFYKFVARARVDSIYNRAGFNTEGDLTAHFGKKKPSAIGDNVKFRAVDYSDNIEVINQFIDEVRAKGATVYFVYPAFPLSAYRRNTKALDSLSKQYKSLLTCRILGSVDSSVLPDSCFFDTVYHLDSVGVQRHTDLVINLLRQNNVGMRTVSK